MLRDYINNEVQEYIKSISNNQIQPELLQKEVDKVFNPREIQKYMSSSYLEQREILASKLLQYFSKKLSIKELKNDSFKHALLTGEEFV